MRKAALAKLLIMFLGLFSLTMIPPLIMALIRGEREMVRAFAIPVCATLSAAVPVFLLFRNRIPAIGSSGGIFLVAAAWISGSLLGAVPYRLSGYVPEYSLAVFESVSGFTTTGASILPDVEILPWSFHLWRGMTHWLGGLGIVVITVALMPILGVGGFQLLKAETSGPIKEKITPKVTATAKILWLIYSGITLLLTLLYLAGGMNLFEALIHSFSTVASGGFSTRNDSLAAFNSPAIEWIAVVFMLLAGFNFTLIYRLFQRRFREVFVNSEARAYGFMILASALIVSFAILPLEGSVGKALRRGFFHTASLLSTTGLAVENHNLWPPLAQMVLFLLLFSSACSGSTSGGIKLVRYVILLKQMKNEILRSLYPSGLFSIRLDAKPGRKDVIYSVSGFVCLYFFTLMTGTLLATGGGMDLYTALNAVALALGNVGLGLGQAISGGIFIESPAWLRWVFSFIMIAGRLELFTVFLLFVPDYWRR